MPEESPIHFILASVSAKESGDDTYIAYALPEVLIAYLAQTIAGCAGSKIWHKGPQGQDWSDPAILIPKDHPIHAHLDHQLALALSRADYTHLLSLAADYHGFSYIYEIKPDQIKHIGDPRRPWLTSLPTASYPAQGYDHALPSYAYSIERGEIVAIAYNPCVKIHFSGDKLPISCESILGGDPWAYNHQSPNWDQFFQWVNRESKANWVCVHRWNSASHAVIWDEVDYLELINGDQGVRLDKNPAPAADPDPQPDQPDPAPVQSRKRAILGAVASLAVVVIAAGLLAITARS